MSDGKERLAGCGIGALAAPFAFLLTWYQAFAEGFVLSKLWLWYAEPLGASPVTWPTFAVGSMAVSIVFLLRIPKARPADTRSERDIGVAWAGYFLHPWLLLVTAWWIR